MAITKMRFPGSKGEKPHTLLVWDDRWTGAATRDKLPQRRRSGSGADCSTTTAVTSVRAGRSAIGPVSGTTKSPYNGAMAISPHWYHENANACAWRAEQSRNPLAKAAYKQMVRAWLILAVSAEELVGRPRREAGTEEHALAA